MRMSITVFMLKQKADRLTTPLNLSYQVVAHMWQFWCQIGCHDGNIRWQRPKGWIQLSLLRQSGRCWRHNTFFSFHLPLCLLAAWTAKRLRICRHSDDHILADVCLMKEYTIKKAGSTVFEIKDCLFEYRDCHHNDNTVVRRFYL